MTLNEQAEAVEATLEGKVWCKNGLHWTSAVTIKAHFVGCDGCYMSWIRYRIDGTYESWQAERRAYLELERASDR